MKRLTFLAVAALLMTPAAASAQNRVPFGVSLGGMLGFNTLSGDDFSGTDAGFGFQLFGRYATPGGFGIGGGFQLNFHNDDFLGETINVLGIYAEPRYTFRSGGSDMAPFVGARLYYFRESVSVGGVDLSATGFGIGALAGIVFQVSPKVGIEPGITFTTISFGDLKADGTTIADSDASGTSLGIQLGIVIALGR